MSLAHAPQHRDVDSALDWAAHELISRYGFDRVMILRLEHPMLRIQTTVFRGAAESARDAHANAVRYPIELTPERLETEMLRRKAPALVDVRGDERAWRPILDHIGVAVYAATPVLAFGRVAVTLHADIVSSGSVLTEVHRDVLAAFAHMCGSVLERAFLRQELANLRNAVRVNASQMLALAAADAMPLERLGCRTPGVEGPVSSRPPEETDHPLTRREVEVLSLMAKGATSAEIARQLVIAPGTAKTHAKNILRKLGASTRAEAVARFLRD
jgi:DNA-binding CsgD family transcriptional regulator/GAF domain-containing protein